MAKQRGVVFVTVTPEQKEIIKEGCAKRGIPMSHVAFVELWAVAHGKPTRMELERRVLQGVEPLSFAEFSLALWAVYKCEVSEESPKLRARLASLGDKLIEIREGIYGE